MNPQNILQQFLGSSAAQSASATLQSAQGRLANSGTAGVVGGLAAGGLLGVLLGNKKARKKVGKLAGGVVGYGGAAALGALAFQAYQNWQSGKSIQAPVSVSPDAGASGNGPTLPPPAPAGSKFDPAAAPAADGRSFELALVLAMIGAANADGHIDADEQKLIFERVSATELEAAEKGFVFDALAKPPSLQEVADFADGPEQGAEIYLASRLAIDPDHPMEHAYMEALAARLSLPAELVAHLESQIAQMAG